MNQQKKMAVVLSSGGIDSTTVMAVAAEQGFAVYSLSFDYGQRHRQELEAAERVARALGAVKHLIIPVGLDKIGGSALTGDMAVPGSRPGHPTGPDSQISDDSDEIPITYVPARNLIFLSCALGWAETLEAADIFIGVNAVDYSGYPDCRRPFIESFEKTAALATRAGVTGRTRITIHTPLINMTKAEIITTGLALGIDYALTLSCYDPFPGGLACGSCASCRIRKKGFAAAGVPDPTRYTDNFKQ